MEPPAHAGPSLAPEGSLASYTRAVAAHPALVALAIVAALFSSLVWLATRTPEYRATARVLIDPVSSDDEGLLGLPLLRDAGDPTRTAQTAAELLRSPRAAEAAARRVRDGWTTASVLEAVTVEPAGQSNILVVTAAASTPDGSARVANAFTDAMLAERAEQLTVALDRELAEPAPDPAAGGEEAAGLRARLERLRRTGDPTVALADPAVTPSSASAAPWWLVIALALIGGAVVGAVAAVVLELRSPRRLADDEELVALLPGPVIARLPERWHRFNGGPDEGYMTPADIAFRALEVQLGLLDGEARTVMISSADERDGKTTLVAALALRLVAEQQPVVAVDLDLHAPALADLLGVPASPGLAAALESGGSVTDALVPVAELPGLSVLPGLRDPSLAALAAVSRRLPALLAELRESGSHVLIDTSPLGTVGDAILMLDGVDEVVVVARAGNTRTAAIESARDCLLRAGRSPSGLVIIGGEAPTPLVAAWALVRRLRGSPAEPHDGDAASPVANGFSPGDRVRWRRGAVHGTGTVKRVVAGSSDRNGAALGERQYVIRTDSTGTELTCRGSALTGAERDD
jgi:succinoglycan biosynthesis transport protein ExoP